MVSRKTTTAALLMLVVGLGAPLVAAERARNPQAGTVFIRVVGTVTLTVREAFAERKEERDVELGTGSGFVFTPFGHVLTNYHVIESTTIARRIGSADVEAELTVERIEVALPGLGDTRYEAVVEAVDPVLDLAVLAVVSADLPYLPLGDSEASDQGDPVRVFGFPFGAAVEVGKREVLDIVPQVSSSSGSVAAVRADDVGGTAYLQTTATVNPGNSGGPMVDEDGYVLGVIRLKLREADGIGFAIPVNAVKEFLTFNGYDPLLPVESLHLGAEVSLRDKGLTLLFPDTLEDVSESRVRVFTDPEQGAIVYTSDRVFTPWDLAALERAFLTGGVFGSFASPKEPSPVSEVSPLPGRVRGSAKGRDARTGAERSAIYSLIELGEEKVLSRYEGPPDAVAFNRSVLERSIDSVAVQSLLARPVAETIDPDVVEWLPRALPAPSAPRIDLPSSWDEEISAPFPCLGVPPMESAIAVSPPGDFTVSLRVGWWARAWDDTATPSCGGRAAALGSSYAYHIDWLGVRYVVEGVLLDQDTDGRLQLEFVAPETKHGFIRDLGRDWLARRAKRD